MSAEKSSGELVRALDWKGAFWVAAGVPPLVLFSIGGIAGVAGKLAFVVWIVSMIMGFLQSFTYAEMAGMFGNKSGGASVYGATAWLRYSKFIAPLSVWCNWFAWSPVLSLGCAIAAGYILNALFPLPLFVDASPEVVAWLADPANAGKAVADAIAAVTTAGTPAIRSWELFSLGIPGLGALHFNATFVIGAVLMLIMLAIQHRGIASTASAQKLLAIIVLVPLLLVGLVPILTGAIDTANVTGLVPPTAAYSGIDGTWSLGGWTLILGALYIAAWSTYGFETAVCYTSELKNPKTDTFKAIFYSGLLCCVFFFLVPFAFQGVLGPSGMLATGIVDGTGIAEALGNMVGGHPVITQIFVILMILALFLAIMTAMAGSSRTLYQGSKDGWLPRYLGGVNENGAPTRAMWTDFTFNLFLLALASDVAGYFYVLAISNVGYIIFNFLNLNAGWIHRVELRPHCKTLESPHGADRHQYGAGLRERPLPRRWRQGVGLLECPVGGPGFRRSHHSGVLFPPLHPGWRQVPQGRIGSVGLKGWRHGRQESRHAAIPDTCCRCRTRIVGQLVLPAACLNR